MISKFTVSNFLSFKNPSSIVFEAAALKDHSERIYQFPSLENPIRLLKSISIYGSNSSGKSNYLKAFGFMKYWVTNSFNDSNKILQIPVEPFLLRKDNEKQTSDFEVSFYLNDIKYKYGFRLTKEFIDEEWLYYSEPKKREQNFFFRKGQEIIFNNSWKRSVGVKIDPIISYVKPKVLFISVLAQFNIDIGNITVEWFNKNLIGFDFSSDYFINKAAALLSNAEFSIAIHELVKQAHLGFSNIEPKIVGTFRANDNYSDEFIRFVLSEEINDYRIQTTHNVFDDRNRLVNKIIFDLRKNESSGSQKFFALAGALLNAIKNKEIIWADELDSKFHPLLFETIIKFFNSSKFNHHGAQLIFTSHSTQLLREKILRRDQVFTVNKNEFGESTIKGIHTVNVRIDASHEKDYLSGKYGGVQKLDFNNAQLNLFDE